MKRILFLPLFLGLVLMPGPAFAAEMPTRDLYVGARGADVTWLQNLLIEKSQGAAGAALKAAGATGYFGPLTRAALAEYQLARKVSPSQGYFGAKTRAMLAGDTVTMHAPTFSGAIEKVRTDCFADGICSVTIDGKEVIILTGMRIDVPPVGKLMGVESIGDLEKMIGATAHVYATTTSEGGADYTLYGSHDYYVKVEAKVSGEPITVRGTIGCLPPKDPTKPTIMMCAFGIKTSDGTYYALSDADGKVGTLDQEKEVEVKGTLVKGEHDTWKSAGTITVTSAKKVK